MELSGYRDLWRTRGVPALLESFGVRFVWLLAAVLAAISFVLLVRIPAQQPEPALPADGLLGETA